MRPIERIGGRNNTQSIINCKPIAYMNDLLFNFCQLLVYERIGGRHSTGPVNNGKTIV